MYSEIGYQKFRTFSGRNPLPTGEDHFEEWLNQATQALDEWGIPETHKKQKITKSLRGPTSKAIRNLKLSKKDCITQDHLNILQDVFWCSEKASDLMYQFKHTNQNAGEKLSDYVRRLDKILHQILLKKCLDPQNVDEIHAQQVLQGAQLLDSITTLLRTGQDGEILNYPDLIRTVREEEAMPKKKKKSQKSESVVEVRVASAAGDNSGVELLKTQVSQLIEMVTEPLDLKSEIATLKMQVSQMMEVMNQSAAKCTEWFDKGGTGQNVPADSSTASGQRPMNQDVCLNCGGVGHYQRVCPSPLKRTEDWRGPQRSDSRMERRPGPSMGTFTESAREQWNNGIVSIKPPAKLVGPLFVVPVWWKEFTQEPSLTLLLR
ncbi:paraneoplastic antigen Ma1 homolog [Lithobates pipiens]